MESIQEFIELYEQQQKLRRYNVDPVYENIYHLSKNIIKAFEDQKKDYDAKIEEMRVENKKLLEKFSEMLASVNLKKTDEEEIADLQARIQAIYNKKRSL